MSELEQMQADADGSRLLWAMLDAVGPLVDFVARNRTTPRQDFEQNVIEMFSSPAVAHVQVQTFDGNEIEAMALVAPAALVTAFGELLSVGLSLKLGNAEKRMVAVLLERGAVLMARVQPEHATVDVSLVAGDASVWLFRLAAAGHAN